MAANTSSHTVISKYSSEQYAGDEAIDDDDEEEQQIDDEEDDEPKNMNLSATISHASQNTTSQSQSFNDEEIKAEEEDVELEAERQPVDVSLDPNQQSVAGSDAATLRDEMEIPPDQEKMHLEESLAAASVADDVDTDEAETAARINAAAENLLKISQPEQHRSSVDSETDDAVGGVDNIDDADTMDTGSEAEFVVFTDALRNALRDALREFDVPLPEMLEIITHLQKTFQSERLIIHEMIVTDFKSFGGTHHVGHFHPRFCIVNGPNGCGKSNVIDGLLFVFGYRSKRLRVERVAELIYNHPNPKKQPQECRVEVFMKVIRPIKEEGVDKFVDVPGKTVRVARVGRKNGSSDYFLDGHKTPQKTVVEKLKTFGIDMDHHRFLILQGEVEQIALMPPKGKNDQEEGLLEYLEDIIGTSRLHEPMKQLQKRLDEFKAEYEIKSKDQLLKHKEVLKLEQLYKDALRVLFFHNGLNHERHKIKAVERHLVAKDIDAAKELIDAKQLESDAVSAELAKSDETKRNLHANVKAAQKAVSSNVKRAEELDSQHQAAEQQISQLKVDMEHAQTAKVKLEKECVTLQKEIDNIDTLPQRLEAEIAQLEADRPNLAQQVDENEQHYKNIVENSKSAADKYRREVQECVEKQKPIKQRKIAKKHARDLKQQEHEAANRSYTDAKASLDRLLTEQADLGIELNNLTEELNSIDDNISTKAQLLQDRAAARGRCKEDIARLEKEVAEKRIEVEKAQQQNQQPARANDSREIKSLMEAKREGRLPGIVGRLGDLAGIDEQYDVAICSLLQNTLNSVVVKTSADARACITYLKEVVKGYPVTFIDLERKWQQNGDKMLEPYNDNPENAPRLFDLIQFDADQPKIRAVYYSFVHNTLVAENTDQAMRISEDPVRRFRRRIVTLQGNVIEPSGSMVGGGRPLHGLIGREARVRVSRISGQAVTPADLAALERQLDECIEQFQAADEKLRNIEAQGRLYAEELKQLRNRKTQIPLEKAAKEARLDNDLPTLLQHAEQNVAQYAPNPVDAEQFRLEMEAIDAELAEIDKEFNVFEREKKRIEGLIQSESTGAAHDAKIAWEESRRALAQCDKSLHKAQTDLRNSGQQLQKHEAQLEKKRKLIESKNAAVAEFAEKLETAEKEVEKLGTDVQTLKAAETELVAAESSAREALAEHVKTCEKHITLLEALRIELETMRKTHANAAKKLPTFNRELQHIETLIVDLGHAWAEKNAKYMKFDYNEEELDAANLEHLEQRLKKHERRVAEANLGKPTDAQRILNQYRQLHDVWMASAAQAKAVETKRKKCEQVYRQIQNQRFDEFFAAFNTINQELKWIFRKLTTGGSAALSVADDLVFYESGIDFKVQPLMKPWREISHLSGGEKTLSSLALIFALHKYRPTPFYIMDEIDAALDHRNVTLVGLFVKLQAAAGQFIVVSHRPEMIVKADRIIGITKPGGQTCSMSISCNLDQTKSIQDLVEEEKAKEKAERRQKRATQEQQKQKRRRNAKSQQQQQHSVQNGTMGNVSDKMSGNAEAIVDVDIDDDDEYADAVAGDEEEAETDTAINTSFSNSILETSLSSMPVESTMNLHNRFAGIRLEQQALTKAAEAAAAAARISNNATLIPNGTNSSSEQQAANCNGVAHDDEPSLSRSNSGRKRSLAEIVNTASEARTPEESQQYSELEKLVMPPPDVDVVRDRTPTTREQPRFSRHSSAASTTSSTTRRSDKKRQRVATAPPPSAQRFPPDTVLILPPARATRSGSVRSLAVTSGAARLSRSRHVDETMSNISGRTRNKNTSPLSTKTTRQSRNVQKK